MNDATLKAAILANPEAKALADVGNDGGCAALIAASAPPVLVETRHTFLSIAADLGPALGTRLIRSLRAAIAGGNLLLDEVQWSLRNGGVDIAHAATRGTIDALAAAEIENGLTTEDATAIKALAYRPDNVLAFDVSRVWHEFRPEGRIP